MRMGKILIVACGMMAHDAALAADYRAEYRAPSYRTPHVIYAVPTYVPYVPPVYYLPSPPQYVQDLRTGAPGYWVQLKPTFFDRIFGERAGY